MIKIKLDKVHSKHIHIDNGGISVSIQDKGLNEGVWFTMSGDYFGYPAVHASMQIDQYGCALLDALEQLIKEARKDMADVNWEARYNQPAIENNMNIKSKPPKPSGLACVKCGKPSEGTWTDGNGDVCEACVRVQIDRNRRLNEH